MSRVAWDLHVYKENWSLAAVYPAIKVVLCLKIQWRIQRGGGFKGVLPPVSKTRAGALVQWLKLPAWKVLDRGFEPHPGLQVSKKQNVSSPLTRKDAILWRASVTER